jgi:hypothetical protein
MAHLKPAAPGTPVSRKPVPTGASTLLSQSLEAFQSLELGQDRVIISVLDTLPMGVGTALGEGFPGVPHVWIFAENVTLSGTMALRNGVLSAHALQVSEEPGLLDVSGGDGDPAAGVNEASGKPGANGEDGEPGGTLSLYLETAGPYAPGFSVAARGGNGGAGQKGRLGASGDGGGTQPTSGGNGGNGGDGGTAVIVAVVPAARWLAELETIFALTPAAAQQAALQALLATLPADAPLAGVRASLQRAATAETDEIRADAMNAAGRQLQVLASRFSTALTAAADVSGGTYGTYGAGSPNGANGRPGAPGRLDPVVVGTPVEVATASFPPFFVAHPSQCARLLERARLMYLGLAPEAVSELTELLLRLQARTQIFVDAADTSPLVAYYAANEARVGAVGAVQQLRAVNAQATRLLDQLRQGRDLFGHNGGYVPRASFGFYKSLLDDLITSFTTLEASYKRYFSALADNDARMEDVKAARDQHRAVLGAARRQLGTLRDEAERTAAVIHRYQASLPAARQALDEAIARVGEQIRTAFDFDFQRLVSAVSMLASAPESQFDLLKETGALLYQSATQITNDQGEPVQRAYIVGRMQAIQADVHALAEGYEQMADGELVPDDPGASKLVVAEEQLTTFLSQFRDRFPGELQALRDAFDAYVGQVVARNNQILSYNATILRLLRTKETLSQGEQDLRRLNDTALATLSPQLPDLVTFVSARYYGARTQFMEVLGMTARAFRYWALSDEDLLAHAVGGLSLPEINAAVLEGARTAVLNAYRSAVESFGTSASTFPAAPDLPGLVVDVPAWQVQRLKSLNEIIVRVPAVTRATTRDESVFAGMANVRVMYVRAWIDGARTREGSLLRVQLTHTGAEQIVSPSGAVFSFAHEPVRKMFIYDPSSERVLEEANFGLTPEVPGSPSTIYAALGPFTDWHLEVRAEHNSELDLSGVTSIRLEFRGTSFAFT